VNLLGCSIVDFLNIGHIVQVFALQFGRHVMMMIGFWIAWLVTGIS
jgi:hypothetical protein